jgi:DNA-binding CsgD family transcriptional regulator
LLNFGLAHFERAVEVGIGALEWTANHGYPDSLEVNIIGGNTVIALRELGRIVEAVALEERLRIQKRTAETDISDVWALVDQTMLACEQGRVDDSLERWKRAERTLRATNATPFTGSLFTCGVEILLWAADPAQAARLALDSLRPRVDRDESRECGHAFSLGMRAAADLAVRGRLLAEADLVEAAQDVAAQLSDLLPRCRFDPFDQPAMPATSRCDHLDWLAEQSRLHGVSDTGAWDAAAGAWEKLGGPVRAAYARYRQAEAQLATPGGRRETAIILRQAVRLAGQHIPVIEATTELARRAHLDLDEQSELTLHSPTSPTPARLATLTSRELAVLREVTIGKTNIEIGAVLFMSPKTVSVHVTHILRKLGIRSRVQAAALAAEAGILNHW